MRFLNLACRSAFCLLAASSVQAADLFIEFTGTMTLNDFSTTNFLEGSGESGAEGPITMSGLLVVDGEKSPRNISSTPDLRLMYSAGIFPGRELALVESHINGLKFDFSQADEAGLDRDALSIGPLGNEQSFAVTDAYRATTGGKCLGEPADPDFCWTVQIAAVLPPETLPIKWPQTFTANAATPGTRISMLFVFFNRDPARGQTGLMSGKLEIDRLTVSNVDPTL